MIKVGTSQHQEAGKFIQTACGDGGNVVNICFSVGLITAFMQLRFKTQGFVFSVFLGDNNLQIKPQTSHSGDKGISFAPPDESKGELQLKRIFFSHLQEVKNRFQLTKGASLLHKGRYDKV